MMTDMLKSVITAGTGYNAYISGLYHAGKTGTSNYSDNELKKLTKDYSYSSIVTPDDCLWVTPLNILWLFGQGTPIA